MRTPFFKRLMNPGTAIIVPLVLILLLLFFSNIDNVLQRFGFETKETVRAQLVEMTAKANLLESENKELQKLIKKKDQLLLAQAEIIEKVHDDNNEVDTIIDGIVSDIEKPFDEKIKEKDPPVTTEQDKVVLDNNIVSINKAFDTLFGV